MRTTYYDTIHSGLVPCKAISKHTTITRCLMIVVEVTRARGVYRKGERLTIMARDYVNRVGSAGALMCKTAPLPENLPITEQGRVSA